MSVEGRASGKTSSVPSGKRESRPLVVAVGGTMSVKKRISNKIFLIDSGAAECAFPAPKEDFLLRSSSSLQAANGSEIKTFGKREIS